ncbi:unnamed protein product [Cuscuta campestris]|uniref:L-ascorbate oxidase n=1 Tax=Cuscuta campestris TaxID=132261 RepID=A0A484LG13_9ASTE|nr:unnamed protein product [Cuscuta campestris]
MEKTALRHLTCSSVFLAVLVLWSSSAGAEDPYKFYEFTATYGTKSLLGFPQEVILINGQFPGPTLNTTTNDNIVLNLINKLDQPLLLTWNGIKQRKNSWQDGVLGTNCPIPPNSNYTYVFQTKDQIGSYTYFPSTGMQKAYGGFGAININQRSVIAVPYPKPDADYTLLIGDWWKYKNHKEMQYKLDSGKPLLPFPNALLINGKNHSDMNITADPGKTCMLRISNVGLRSSINFRIQNHRMKLVEMEGSHVIQNYYDSLDIHVGQSFTVLVTLDQPQPKDYLIVASTRFSNRLLNATAVLRYSNSNTPAALDRIPPAPRGQLHWSMKQARSIRWNLTANAARPNPQGSYHYGTINITKTLVLTNSAPVMEGKQRYAVNGLSYVNPTTPLKLADWLNITGVFTLDDSPFLQTLRPSGGPVAPYLATPVIPATLHDFVQIVFQNNEKTMQSWHLDGHDFWVVGYGSGKWNEGFKKKYNLVDAPTRHTVQVYPNRWTAILVSLDNKGMWNIRSAMWDRAYLGQQCYLKVYSSEISLRTEYEIPKNALLCGKALHR